jgi:hypothetical protein
VESSQSHPEASSWPNVLTVTVTSKQREADERCEGKEPNFGDTILVVARGKTGQCVFRDMNTNKRETGNSLVKLRILKEREGL